MVKLFSLGKLLSKAILLGDVTVLGKHAFLGKVAVLDKVNFCIHVISAAKLQQIAILGELAPPR
jgi:hypothetical protein